MNYRDPRSMVGVDQLLAILDYMKDNPQLAHSRFSRTKEGRNLLKRHWTACADLANNVALDCTQKTPDQWRSYYNAYKSKLKKKVKDMNADLVASGGGPARKRLSDLENRLFLILGPDLGEQLPRVCNTPVSLQRLETEHQPSSSTAEVLLQDDTNFTIRSDSSNVELYYPEDHTGHLATNLVGNLGQLAADSVVHTDRQLDSVAHTVQQPERVVHTVQQLEPVVHNVQQLEPVVHNVPQLESVVHTVQQPERMVHTVQQPERVVHTVQQSERVVHIVQQSERVVHTGQQSESVVLIDQQPESVVLIDQQPERMVLIDQHPEPVVHIDQHLEPMAQQPDRMVRSGRIKRENVEGSPRRPSRRANSEQDAAADPAIREATEALLNLERMKTEAKQHATAALHRMAGAMEAIAERLGGGIRLQVTSPPRARRRYARISSSESD